MDPVRYNRRAWDRKVAEGCQWTLPVAAEVVAAARRGRWSVILTPTVPVPRDWFPADMACDLLGLACGGGQQAPVLAAAGARVTVLDNSPAQLGQDRAVADREGLQLITVQGDMADLGCFDDASFDVIFHPVANCFVPGLEPVWRECFRVLRPGGSLLAGFMNPVHYLFDFEKQEEQKVLEVANTLPYADVDALGPDGLAKWEEHGWPLEWSHTLTDQIGGQLAAGFLLAGFYEDRFAAPEEDLLSGRMDTMVATRAVKPVTR